MPPLRTLLVISSILTIVALGFMVWSMLVPTPMPVMLAMSVGQGLGIMAFGLYGLAIYLDLRRGRREARESMRLPKISDSKPEAKSGAKTEAKSQSKTESKSESKTETTSDAKAESAPAPSAEEKKS
jgi:hypothetical protein